MKIWKVRVNETWDETYSSNCTWQWNFQNRVVVFSRWGRVSVTKDFYTGLPTNGSQWGEGQSGEEMYWACVWEGEDEAWGCKGWSLLGIVRAWIPGVMRWEAGKAREGGGHTQRGKGNRGTLLCLVSMQQEYKRGGQGIVVRGLWLDTWESLPPGPPPQYRQSRCSDYNVFLSFASPSFTQISSSLLLMCSLCVLSFH